MGRLALALVIAAAVAAPARAEPHGPLRFAVISDLHLMAVKSDTPPAYAVKMIDAVLAQHPRLVVITGDFTNGTTHDAPGVVAHRKHAWAAVRALLQPLRDAGIPVLPIPGNHDTYQAAQRALYAETWKDLAAWAAPLAIEAKGGHDIDAAPFSYAVDVDGVHLALGYFVDQVVHAPVRSWLADDLAKAKDARVRLVFGHVPMSSVIAPPSATFVKQLGAILVAGHADAYIAGHEHLVWDEDVPLADGVTLRQILVGTATGEYDYGPRPAERKRAACAPSGAYLECKLPHGGLPFQIRPNTDPDAHGALIEARRATFTMITVDGTTITAEPIAVDRDGKLLAFDASNDPPPPPEVAATHKHRARAKR